MRSVADVSADADPATGIAVYGSYVAGGWQGSPIGGTVVAAAIVAGAYALNGVPAAATSPASYLYAHPSLFNDITSGTDGTCSPAYLCTAGPGYDGPTGLGTPAGGPGFAVASQASTGDLSLDGLSLDGSVGSLGPATPAMAAGTSPGIAALPNGRGGWVVAWQANTTDLYTDTSAGAAKKHDVRHVAGHQPGDSGPAEWELGGVVAGQHQRSVHLHVVGGHREHDAGRVGWHDPGTRGPAGRRLGDRVSVRHQRPVHLHVGRVVDQHDAGHARGHQPRDRGACHH
jgi:hypothetical protein